MTDAAVGQKCPECSAPQHRTQVVAVRETWGVRFATSPVTLTLIVVNVVIYLVGRSSPDANLWLRENWALIKALAPNEWWRPLTAAFLHGSLFHLGINMYILYMLGPQLEKQTGKRTFAALYFASAAAGGALSVLTGPAISNGFLVVSIGASGAIFGLMGAWFSASYRHRHTPAGSAMFNQMLIWLAISAAFPFLVDNIDWRAHVGGLIAGISIHQLWTRFVPDRPVARVARTLIAVAVGVLALALVAFL
jgi:membrane associated rhomboid family serine protease